MTGRVSDEHLIGQLAEMFDRVDPVPQEVIDRGRAALMRRTQNSGGSSAPPVADLPPAYTPGGATAPDDDVALPGFHRPRFWIVPATPPRWGRRLRRAAWLAAGVAAFALLIPLAMALGMTVAALWLLYGPT